MSGTWRTFQIVFRTSWMIAVLPPLALTTLTWIMAGSISRTYDDEASRTAYAQMAAHSPATLLLQGRGYDVDTAGGIFAQQMAIIVLTFFLLYAAWLGVHLTRTLEDKGYFDVMSSGTVGRLAPTGAGLLVAMITCALTAVGTSAACLASGFGIAGALGYGAIVGLAMTAASALGTLSAQLFQHATEALYACVIVVIAFYLLRGWIDFKDWNAAWTNPANWLAEARPFGDDIQAWPYIAFLASAGLASALTFYFASHRDLGSGIIPARACPAEARPILSTPLSLLARLSWRTTAVAIIVGGLVALVFGAFVKDLGTGDGLDAQLVFLMQLNAEVAIIAALAAVGVFASEERSGRAGRILSEPVSRWRWYTDGTVVGLASALITLLALACCSGLGLLLSTAEPDRFVHAITDSLAYYPAVAWCGAMAILLAAIRPGLNAIMWFFAGWAVIVTLPSNVLDLSDTARHLSPVEWIGQMPESDWATGNALWMTAIVLVGITIGALLFRRRDLTAG